MAISSKMLGKAVSRVFPQWLQIGGAPKKFYNNKKKRTSPESENTKP